MSQRPTAAPDHSGVCGADACPAPRGPIVWGRAREHAVSRADDAFPLAGRAGGIHQPRPGQRAGTVAHVVGATGQRCLQGRAG